MLKSRLLLLVLGLALACAFAGLGRWQWQRAVEKEVMLASAAASLADREARPLASAGSRGGFSWAAGRGHFVGAPFAPGHPATWLGGRRAGVRRVQPAARPRCW